MDKLEIKLEAIVEDYMNNWCIHLEDELDEYRKNTFSGAVRQAATAKNKAGNRYSHQKRITYKAIENFGIAINLIKNDIKNAKSFEDIFNKIAIAIKNTKGVGEVMHYDTALRLGANLKKYPDRVYIHAGPRIGLKNLIKSKDKNIIIKNERSIDKSDLPYPLDKEIPIYIEAILCIYKDCFKSDKPFPKCCPKKHNGCGSGSVSGGC